jgi:Zn-dependent protease with chaperone function
MSLRRRFLHGSLAFSLLVSALPAPAGATSTATEVQQAKDEEKQVLSQYNVVTDPLLNAWVNGVGEKVWGQVARRDVPYNIKILDASDINSFTIGGGYIYVNKGLLDFVQSDDELAGVIGHETGHNERRHTLTLPAKAQALNLLFGIASLFSPIIYRFGQIAEAGIIAKQERADELQADQYGLLLMTRAGYDPEAMLSFMQHLGAAENEHDSAVDKYLADHPGFPSRVSHLVGYDELDPTKRTNDELLAEALHDQDESRYNIAAMKYTRVLKADPGNTIALLHMGEAQIALGQTGKSEQTLGEAAEKGTPETRSAALNSIQALRQSESRFTLTKPSLAPLRAELADVQLRETQAEAALQLRREAGRDQLKAVNARIQNISYGIPDLSRVPIRMGSRLEAILKNFGAMSRAIDASFSKSSSTISGVGTLERNKESGLVKENDQILHELAAPLQLDPVPVESLAILPSYPRMFDDLALTDGDMIRALDASRSSLALLDVALGDLNDFVNRLTRSNLDYQGDITISDYNALTPMMQKAADGLNRAAIAGSQAEQLFNLARSRQLQTRITMLGTGYPENRYATLQTALKNRVQNDGVDFTTMQHDDLTPGEVAAASIVAADTNTTPDAVIQEAVTSNRRIVDVANARGMSSTALEIFLGLVYLDYTDDPQKEAAGH